MQTVQLVVHHRAPVTTLSATTALGLGLCAGIIAAAGDGTFCFFFEGVLELPNTPLRLVGPGLVLGLAAYWAHRPLRMPTRSATTGGNGARVTLGVAIGWSLAFGIGLYAQTLGSTLAPLAYALAGLVGTLGLIAGVWSSWRPALPFHHYALPLLFVGSVMAMLQPLIMAALQPLLDGAGTGQFMQRITGNLLFFAPWQAAVLATSLVLLCVRGGQVDGRREEVPG